MDVGNGRFVPLQDDQVKAMRVPPTEEEIMNRIFFEGEEVRLKGSRFAIKKIYPEGGMLLKLLPRR